MTAPLVRLAKFGNLFRNPAWLRPPPARIFAQTYVNEAKYSTDSASQLIEVDRESFREDVAIVKMNKKPVNSLDRDFLTEMLITLEKLHSDKTCRGLILTSSVPNIFTAGLDIREFYQKKLEETDAFWRSLQDFWLCLYGSRLACMAAINGHSPAGGCLMAISCDYRVMAQGKYKIGLNQTLLGIVAPFWFTEVMGNTVGYRETEKALQLGELYGVEEALGIHLIDQAVPLAQVLEATKKRRWRSGCRYPIMPGK